jgi:tetratricopeptide (TPR) repeat protein
MGSDKDLEEYERDYLKRLEEKKEASNKDSAAWHDKGVALSDLEKYEESIVCYDQAIKLNPKNSAAWHDKGVALSNLEKYEESIACYDEVIKSNPKNSAAWEDKGVSLYRLEKYEETIACCDEVIRLNPESHTAWHNKGYSLASLGKDEEPIACYDEAIRLNPEFYLSWFGKAYSLKRLGRDEEAEQCFAKGEALKNYEKGLFAKYDTIEFQMIPFKGQEKFAKLISGGNFDFYDSDSPAYILNVKLNDCSEELKKKLIQKIRNSYHIKPSCFPTEKSIGAYWQTDLIEEETAKMLLKRIITNFSNSV